MGETNARLQPSCSGAVLMTGKMLNGEQSIDSLKMWVESLIRCIGKWENT